MESTMNTLNNDGQQPVFSRPNLTVVPHAEEGAPAARLRRSVSRMLRGRRVRRRPVLRSLVIEQVAIGHQRDPSTTSYAENLTRALGKGAGDTVLGKTQRCLARLAGQADGLRAEQGRLRAQASYRQGDLVRHPDGGVQTVAETAADQDKQRAAIAADIEAGSRRHRRLPKALRRVPILVLIADGLLLLYFFSGVTNVDWSSPVSAALVFAIMLAAMVTGISFGFFRLTGDRLQQYKNHAGTVPLRGLDEATVVVGGLSIAAITVLSSLMYFRMHAEVVDALGSSAGASAFIIGLTLAMVSVLANTMVIVVHALDGSTEADRLDALGDAVSRPRNTERRMLEHADTLDQQIAVLGRKADRLAAEGITKAGRQRAGADQLIDAGRAVHQGVGPLSEPTVDPNGQEGIVGYRRTDATPEVDQRPVKLTLHHIRTPLDGGQQDAVAGLAGRDRGLDDTAQVQELFFGARGTDKLQGG
jgi:hypothetical protein